MLTQKPGLIAPVIFLLVFLAFLPALSAGFTNWDDDKNFTDNPNYRGLGATELEWMWTTHLLGAYVPISWMTLGLDYTIWGTEPFGYHLTSLLWHCANAVLIYFIALVLFGKSPHGIAGACVAALLFAIHPLRAESVAWITERRDVVSGFFFLAAVLLYLRHHRRPETLNAERRTPNVPWLSLVCFTIAVFAKSMAVTLPAILLLLDVFPLGRLKNTGIRRLIVEKLPFFAIAFVASAIAFYALRHDGLTPLAEIGPFQRVAMSIYGLAFYVWKTVMPIDLAPFYAITPNRLNPVGFPLLASLAFVALIIAAAVLFRRRWPAVTIAAAAYVVMLLPVVGIFHNGQQIVADRYSYLPCMSWAMLAGCAIMFAWKSNLKPAIAAAAAVIASFGFLTWRQSTVWHDSQTLWTHALAVEPSFIAWNNMGMVESEAGDRASAIQAYRASIAMFPGYADAHNNLGGALLVFEDWEQAIREFRTALKIKPAFANSEHGMGFALVQEGKIDEGIDHLRRAVDLDPTYEKAQETLGWALDLKKKSAAPH